ncbi:IclR family transcriptional regulator [Rhodococcus sp. 114MFTsu3.1]|uniref:IclR family transcriptional regulator n=1 Tax=Rhodococcus sp. 114MFTsu3.1 TaxID=1172184 RepID=UPI0009DC0960|nr:IclR family transcriptional regulator C-terminal domain-containing protein [Rhodococcus sp. 114MFTsu3.1]
MSTPPPKARAVTTLQTLARGLAFLEEVAASQVPPTVKEVAERLGLNITTSYHLFNTLVDLGYLTRDANSTLHIGAKSSALAQAYRRTVSPHGRIVQLVQELSALTNETASASMVVDNRMVVQALAEGTQPVKATGLYIGLTGHEYLRASGRLALALLDADASKAMFTLSTARLSAMERGAAQATLDEELPDTRSRGWSLDPGDYQEDISGVSAPILSPSGTLIGTINLSTPSTRFAVQRDRLIACVTEHAARASELVAHSEQS